MNKKQLIKEHTQTLQPMGVSQNNILVSQDEAHLAWLLRREMNLIWKLKNFTHLDENHFTSSLR